jgi:hypothetical protein
VLALSWKAQNRLHSRFMRLAARRLPRNKIVVAIARELRAFIWALLRNQSCYLEIDGPTHTGQLAYLSKTNRRLYTRPLEGSRLLPVLT